MSSILFVNAGATSPVTPRKEVCSYHTLGNFGMLKMVNNHKVLVLCIVTICLESNNYSKLVLNNVKHAL